MLKPLQDARFTPKLHIMDNKASAALKAALRKHKVKYQLAPLHLHRQNAAERAIQTFKAHLIVGLCSIDPDYLATEWNCLLEQAEITINLLRACRINPKISAHNAVFGAFDFNKTPLAPPGTKVIVHKKLDNRRTWAPRGTEG